LDFITVASLVRTQTQKTSGGAKRRHPLLGLWFVLIQMTTAINHKSIATLLWFGIKPKN